MDQGYHGGQMSQDIRKKNFYKILNMLASVGIVW